MTRRAAADTAAAMADASVSGGTPLHTALMAAGGASDAIHAGSRQAAPQPLQYGALSQHPMNGRQAGKLRMPVLQASWQDMPGN